MTAPRPAPGTASRPAPGTASRPAPGIWRWQDRLPLRDARHRISLGEGDTPLVDIRAAFGGDGPDAWLKCEHLNPTGSYKDRVAAVALSMVRERGLRGIIGTSSGNGGAAAAAYAARAGATAVLLALSSTPAAKLDQLRAAGGLVQLVDGLGHDAATTEQVARRVAALAPHHGLLAFLTGGRYAPEVMTGARTVAYELAEQCPDATHVYAPVGGGGLFASLWRGYRDVAGHLGQAAPAPRLVAVQPAGCPTVAAALAGRPGRLETPSTTSISGLQVAVLYDDDVPAAIGHSAGHLTEVTDAQVLAARTRLARLGILVEPAGATALAGALADAAAGRIGPGDRVALVATGAGWKDPAALHDLGAGTDQLPADLADLVGEIVG